MVRWDQDPQENLELSRVRVHVHLHEEITHGPVSTKGCIEIQQVPICTGRGQSALRKNTIVGRRPGDLPKSVSVTA